MSDIYEHELDQAAISEFWAHCRSLPTSSGRMAPQNCEVSPAPDLTFEKWRTRVQVCMSTEQLLLAVAAYLAAWRLVDINRLPVVLTSPIKSVDELHNRAVDLVQAEVIFRGSNADWALLRELALVITAAAARARYLESLKVH